ncbi:hypothetical protein EUTSA_v10024151mg [Eutrema salsugineum]|uniref:Bifunctional inhibitor/plant lipid transfer protein/seed storage helical domain-containing protein n=1 Tax=Eutrema salsugineum TaxID=72664 RepID=V4JVD8_EUTSA|nr:defensin-like protein 250 [Eutrema salsugineum]ESQ29370.1 hypothetical protein EUTSA_v10024151mg [Eutrema salsugineum]
MKLAAILSVSCVLFSLLPSLTVAEIRPWCQSRQQTFDGLCQKNIITQCYNELVKTFEGSLGQLGPIETGCSCFSLPQNKHLCSCPFIPCPPPLKNE